MKTRNIVFATLLMFFITLEVLIALDYSSKTNFFQKQGRVFYASFVELQNQIGYVGLIHNFKNYIHRPDVAYYKKSAEQNYALALAELIRIEKIGSEVLPMPLKMKDTRAMLNAYKERLDFIPGFVEQGLSIHDIEYRVSYDDVPAHDEIEIVSHTIASALDKKIEISLNRSFKLAFITLLGILFSLIMLIRFYFKEQEQILKETRMLNEELEHHRKESIRSQSALLSMMSDVKQEKDQASKLNTELYQVNSEMEQFMFTVSHDLKSPLVTIGGFVKKLSDELSDKVTEQQKNRFARVLDNVNNMGKLLTDLLDLSRLSQQEHTKSMVDLKHVIDNKMLALESVIESTDVEFTISSSLHDIFCNERLLSECMLNLISNAISYKDINRPLKINIWTTQTESNTIVYVQDNGIGIDEKYFELIFGIFERLSSSVPGTGVGLAIVKASMDKQQGWVSVESELGVGSTFALHFLNKL